MAHYPGLQGPLARFLSTVPDWSVLDTVALENAIKGLPVPVVGPALPGISVHDAIKVKLHDFLLYYIVYDIVYDIVRPTYDIVRQNTGSCHFDVRCRIRCRIRHRMFF